MAKLTAVDLGIQLKTIGQLPEKFRQVACDRLLAAYRTSLGSRSLDAEDLLQEVRVHDRLR